MAERNRVRRDRLWGNRGTIKIKHQHPQKRPIGRPPDYREHYAELVFKLRLLGIGDERICHVMSIDVIKLMEWRNSIPEFAQAWNEGGEEADANVAHSLYHRAIGFTTEQEKLFFEIGRASCRERV